MPSGVTTSLTFDRCRRKRLDFLGMRARLYIACGHSSYEKAMGEWVVWP